MEVSDEAKIVDCEVAEFDPNCACSERSLLAGACDHESPGSGRQ